MRGEPILALSGFVILAIIVSWPLGAHIGAYIPGTGRYYDPVGYYNDFWYLATHHVSLFSSHVQSSIDAPFGRPLLTSAFLLQLTTYGTALLAIHLVSLTTAFTLIALAWLACSSTAMYLFVRWLGAGRLSATWAGAVIMLCPYENYRVSQQLPLALLAWAPLVLWASLRWVESPTRRRALFVALSIAFAWVVHPYYGFMAFVIAATVIGVDLVRHVRTVGVRTSLVRVCEIVVAVAVIVIAPLVTLLRLNQSLVQSSFGAHAAQAEGLSAHVSQYLWPPDVSWLLTNAVGARWFAMGSHAGTTPVFFGWTTIALALAWGAICWRRWDDVTARQRIFSITGAILAVVLIACSLKTPVVLGPLRIPTPTAVLPHVVPFLRFYNRFGAPALVVVTALGALTMDWVLRRTNRSQGIALTIAIGAISGLELPTIFHVTSAPVLEVSTPAHPYFGAPPSAFSSWSWLNAHQSEGIVMEFPTSGVARSTARYALDRIWMYGQTIHHLPIANGGLSEGTIGDWFGVQWGDPRLPNAAGTYATLGIHTVVVNPWAYIYTGLTPPDTRHPLPGYTQVIRYPDGTAIWRVTAPPEAGVVVYENGFTRVDQNAWSCTATAHVALFVPRAGNYLVDVLGAALSAGSRISLTVSGAHSRSQTVTVAPGGQIAFPLDLPQGTSEGQIDVRGPLGQPITYSLRSLHIRAARARSMR